MPPDGHLIQPKTEPSSAIRGDSDTALLAAAPPTSESCNFKDNRGTCSAFVPREEGMDYGSVPQWITALIAAIAACVALCAIRTQRENARKEPGVGVLDTTEGDPDGIPGCGGSLVDDGEMGDARSDCRCWPRDEPRQRDCGRTQQPRVHEPVPPGLWRRALV